MKAFLDTSSLLKLYHYEINSDTVRNSLSKGVDEIFLSDIAVLELRSAVWKKVRVGELDEDIAVGIISCFQADYDNFQWIRLQSDIIKTASDLLMKYSKEGLRTLDSLQLASALTLKGQENCFFLTSDKVLKSLFKKENLKII